MSKTLEDVKKLATKGGETSALWINGKATDEEFIKDEMAFYAAHCAFTNKDGADRVRTERISLLKKVSDTQKVDNIFKTIEEREAQ